MGGEGGYDESLSIYLVYRTQKNNSLETIPSRFSLNRNQRSLLLNVICVQYTSGIWNLEFINICTNCRFIWLGKVYI